VAYLKHIFQRELHDAIRQPRARDLPETAITQIRVRNRKLRCIECVEKFRPKLQRMSFVVRHGEILHERQVKRVSSRPYDWVSRRISVNQKAGSKSVRVKPIVRTLMRYAEFLPGQRWPFIDTVVVLAVEAFQYVEWVSTRRLSERSNLRRRINNLQAWLYP